MDRPIADALMEDARAIRNDSADIEAVLNPAAPATPDTPVITPAGRAAMRQDHTTGFGDG